MVPHRVGLYCILCDTSLSKGHLGKIFISPLFRDACYSKLMYHIVWGRTKVVSAEKRSVCNSGGPLAGHSNWLRVHLTSELYITMLVGKKFPSHYNAPKNLYIGGAKSARLDNYYSLIIVIIARHKVCSGTFEQGTLWGQRFCPL